MFQCGGCVSRLTNGHPPSDPRGGATHHERRGQSLGSTPCLQAHSSIYMSMCTCVMLQMDLNLHFLGSINKIVPVTTFHTQWVGEGGPQGLFPYLYHTKHNVTWLMTF